MSDRTVRQSARDFRAALGVPCDQLLPASKLIALAASRLNLRVRAVPKGDPLLAGALAMLDRGSHAIWIDSSRSEQNRNFYAAHEIAHVVWHQSGRQVDIAKGYSHRQRRELDADIWALEFLAPNQAIVRAFVSDRLGASKIADSICIPKALAIKQLRETLLHDRTAPNAGKEPSLDSSQLAAATVPNGPYLLSAGPGTGKTRTLIARCQWLIEHAGVHPESILMLTYSRNGASELRQRLSFESGGPWVGTFHAFALETLQRFGDQIGLRTGWSLCSATEAARLLEDELARRGLPAPQLPLGTAINAISRAKDELCGSAQYERLVRGHIAEHGSESADSRCLLEMTGLYPLYESALARAGRVDFAGLICRTVELLETCPDVRDHLWAQFPNVLADEYQDVNFATSRMLKLLGGVDGKALWVVGDHRQSIYRFLGASPANVEQFGADYPSGMRGSLAVNYRSTPSIVQVFQSAAERLSTAEPDVFRGWRAARPRLGDAPSVRQFVAETELAQMHGIAREIRNLRGCGNSYSDMAVLCRTNQQAEEIARSLDSKGIPVQQPSGILDRDVVKDLVCLLRVCVSKTPERAPEMQRATRVLRLR